MQGKRSVLFEKPAEAINIEGCCIDRLSWHGLPDEWSTRTELVRLAR